MNRAPLPGEPGFIPYGERWNARERTIARVGCAVGVGAAFGGVLVGFALSLAIFRL